MFCKNCGKEIDNTTKFCPECGTPVFQTPVEQASQKTEAYIPMPETSAPVAMPKKKKKWHIPTVIVTVIVILGGIFAGLYFGTDIFKNGDNEVAEKKICKNCEKDLDAGFYCEECINELKADLYPGNPAICISCYIKAINEMGEDAAREIFLKKGNLPHDEIFHINKVGVFYCKNCKSNPSQSVQCFSLLL